MSTYINIDQDLVNAALKLGHFKTKKDAINTALHEFVEQQQQLEIIELFGQFDPDPEYDYKQGRKPI